MNEPLYPALALAAGLAVFGVWTAVLQVRGLRELAARPHVPSDEYAYLRGRHRRRLVIAVLVLFLSLQFAAAYLSGMEAVVAGAGNPAGWLFPRQAVVRFWGFFWIWVMIQTFALIGLAVSDAWESRRYWYGQLKQLREEHHSKLRRDLAVYKTQHQRRGGRYGGRLGGTEGG